MLFLYLSLLGLVSAADPLKDFCRLHGHQTAVVDRKLYVDGGFVNWMPLSANPINYTNTWLRAGDFDVNHEGFPQQTILAKNETVPSVSGGVLWPDPVNKVIYSYGGEYGNGQPQEFKMMFYDIVYNTWNASIADVSSISRAAWGAGTTSPDKGIGYYYGGYLTPSSKPEYNTTTALSTLITYDMLSSRFRNHTGPDNIPRAEGVLLYIPAGDAGLLLYLGGIQMTNNTRAGHPMTEILVHDIANGLWYKQLTSSITAPSPRRRFCAGVAWAPDRSSYNIYLFGGASIDEGVGFGDVWILSLPSFRWVKYFPGTEDDPVEIPHHSASCDVYSGSQMLVMGGHFPDSTACDVPSIYGQHGLDLGRANKLGAKWVAFNASKTTYTVPPELTRVIGGDGSGGATVKEPKGGWDAGGLSVLFQRAYTPVPREPTRFIPPSIAPTAAGDAETPNDTAHKTIVIGGAVGGVCALLLVGGVALCLCLRRRGHRGEEGSGGGQGREYRNANTVSLASPPDLAVDLKGLSTNTSPSTKVEVPKDTHLELPGSLAHTSLSPLQSHPLSPYTSQSRFASPYSLQTPSTPQTPYSQSNPRQSNTETLLIYAPLLGAPLSDADARPWLREERLMCELESVEGRGGYGEGKEGSWRGGWL